MLGVDVEGNPAGTGTVMRKPTCPLGRRDPYNPAWDCQAWEPPPVPWRPGQDCPAALGAQNAGKVIRSTIGKPGKGPQ